MTREEWRPVAGYESAYEVSDRGRVRSLDRIAKHPRGGSQKVRGRMLAAYPSWNHMGQVRLYADGWQRKVMVSTLVAEAFPHLKEKVEESPRRQRAERPAAITYDAAVKRLAEAEQAVAWYKAQLAAMLLAHEQLKAQLHARPALKAVA